MSLNLFQLTERGNDMSNTTFNWNDRLALIDHYKPTDEQACSTFGVTTEELKTAREMRTAGAFRASTTIDVNSYSNLFSGGKTERPSATSVKKPKATKPITATKTIKEPQKRGRKGDKIAKAFASIPNTPTPIEQYANTSGVSVAVLRQSKRFDKSPELGNVCVKKDKETKNLMIWREESK
jgi:hypothetical protein